MTILGWLADKAITLAIGATLGIVVYHFGIMNIYQWIKGLKPTK